MQLEIVHLLHEPSMDTYLSLNSNLDLARALLFSKLEAEHRQFSARITTLLLEISSGMKMESTYHVKLLCKLLLQYNHSKTSHYYEIYANYIFHPFHFI